MPLPVLIGAALFAHALSVAVAMRLDAALGEPRVAWHPVRLLGGLIARLELPLRRLIANESLAGVALVVLVVLAAVVPATALSLAAWSLSFVHPALGLVAGVAVDGALIFWTLSARNLAEEGRAVSDALRRSLPAGRRRVARLVGRDTDSLDEAGVARACVETLAENTVDAVIAPLFWGLVVGGAGAWLHKAASTLDSMVGYRNERYGRFGSAGARLDDVLAWLPARVAVPTIALAARAMKVLDSRAALAVGLRDRLRHASPNSAHGEAAFAGALHVQLGGEASYGGDVRERPVIGAEFDHPRREDILRAARLVLASAETAALVCVVAGLVAGALAVLLARV